jgi:hypothetical protein
MKVHAARSPSAATRGLEAACEARRTRGAFSDSESTKALCQQVQLSERSASFNQLEGKIPSAAGVQLQAILRVIVVQSLVDPPFCNVARDHQAVRE